MARHRMFGKWRVLTCRHEPWLRQPPTQGAQIVGREGVSELRVRVRTGHCHCAICGHKYTEGQGTPTRRHMECSAETCSTCCGGLCT